MGVLCARGRKPGGPPRQVVLLACLACLACLGFLSGCAGGATATPAGRGTPDGAARYPDIERVAVTRNPDGSYDFAVTVSSPYDRPERYADGWRLLTPEGTELAVHQLDHDHQTEQPFTRTQARVRVPDGVARVTVQGHDQRSGYGGKTVETALPNR